MELHNQYIRPMLTDLYQFTMCYAYWKNNHHNDIAVFDLFFRKCPFKGEYCIFAGLSEVVKLLKNFKYSEEEINYLRTVMADAEEGFFEFLASIDASSLQIYAVPDGTVVFPKENLIRVEGPVAVAQLLETTLLALTNFPSLIATNAYRHKRAAGPDKVLVEFGLRRAQGTDGAMTASKYAYLGGFDMSSNMLACMLNQIPPSGTHAHSYISSYIGFEDLEFKQLKGKDVLELALKYRSELGFFTNDGELAAFISYAVAFPNGFLALVDTYDTLGSGVPNFLCVALAIYEIGYKPIGIRLDSGDLSYLSKQTRQMFTRVGSKCSVPFENLKIVASNELNEQVLRSLREQGHEVDVFGIGTNLVTCQGQPALGMVYKLVSIKNIPRIKLSNEKEKITIPGKKKIYRLYNTEGIAICDLLMGDSEPEPLENQRILVKHPFDERKRMYVIPSRVENLHKLIWNYGQACNLPSLKESRNYFEEKISSIRRDITRGLNPTPYKLSVSVELYDFMNELWNKELPIPEVK